MNEQEIRFEDQLFKLIEVAGKYLKVLGPFTSTCSREKEKTGSRIYSNRVYLILHENDSFEEWVDALIKAEDLLGKLEDKRGWEKQNPIFHERIAARLQHIQSYDQG